MTTPMAARTSLSAQDGELLADPKQYRSLVGALQYCTLTRPDLIFVVNEACQFLHANTTAHWNLVKRILRYLKTTSSHGISFCNLGHLSLTSYTDADWANCPDDRRNTSGYCVFLGSNLVSWSSTKQKVVSRSSAESEYRGLSNAATELGWIQSLLSELGLSPSSPPLLLCDNSSATYLAANPVFHSRSKHIEIDHHFIREKVLRKQLFVRFVPSEDQLADILTKPLATSRFQSLRNKLTVLPRSASLAGG
ncbi:MAG: Ty1/Copia family ribonuclease HI [Sweet potato little leaf phytoplasma]|nr:Ty1/Copia family ribonuclease HI [Sweet potato little leaf phytoplasma]